MEKLNELAEQAKFVADWHGSDWSSALCQDKDGKQAHEIICESRGEAVISTGSNSNEASWLCDYLELCSPENILAIAEAYRALAQRAEAAEAKLAELEKQEPVAYTDAEEMETLRKGTFADMFTPCDAYKSDPQWIPLFTRAAPAADLAELAPEEVTRNDAPCHLDAFGADCWVSGANWMRAAMLQNIKEKSK